MSLPRTFSSAKPITLMPFGLMSLYKSVICGYEKSTQNLIEPYILIPTELTEFYTYSVDFNRVPRGR